MHVSFAGFWTGWTILCGTLGALVGVCLGLACCIYVATLHENDLWFSNIKVTMKLAVCIDLNYVQT